MFCSSVFTGKHGSELSKIGSDILGMVHVQRVDGKDLEWSVVQGFAELDGCCLCCSSDISEVRGRATECESLSGEGGGGPEAERIGKQKEKRNKGKGGCEQGGADMRSVRWEQRSSTGNFTFEEDVSGGRESLLDGKPAWLESSESFGVVGGISETQ
jgi:hypothetical protein